MEDFRLSNNKKYEKNGWKGNVSGQSKETRAGGIWKKDKSELPEVDTNGKKIKYKEFDINDKLPNAGRDGERFIKGSDGSVYYTDDHYDTLVKVSEV